MENILFIKHDLYHSFEKACEYGNDRFARKLIEDEVAKLVAFRRQQVIDLLRSKGYKLTKRCSNDKIVKTIIDNRKNEDLSRAICKMIIENNSKNKTEVIDSAMNFNGGGKYTQKSKPLLKIKDKEFEDKLYTHYLNIEGTNVNTLAMSHNTNKVEIDKTNPEYKKAMVRTAVTATAITLGAVAATWGIYWLVKRVKNPAKPEQPAAVAAPAPVATTEPAAAPAKVMNANDYNENNYKPE